MVKKRKNILDIPKSVIFVMLLIIPFSNLYANENNIKVFSSDMLLLEQNHFENNCDFFASTEGSGFDDLERNSTLSTLHSIFGYTSVALGVLTGILNPNNVNTDFHRALGYTSAGMSAVTLGFGFAAHLNELSFESGINSNIIHTILGIAGSAMMIISPFLEPDDAHVVLGALGTSTMGVSILTKLIF